MYMYTHTGATQLCLMRGSKSKDNSAVKNTETACVLIYTIHLSQKHPGHSGETASSRAGVLKVHSKSYYLPEKNEVLSE